MDVLLEARQILADGADFVKSSNYYFQNHQCPAKGENIKVNLDFKIKQEAKAEAVTFGICPHCKTIFYHQEIESHSF